MARLVRRASLLIFLCFIIASTIMVNAKAEVVGVSQGNIFKYNINANWNSPLNATAPADFSETNQTAWIRVTVTGVSGSVISTQITTHYRNGTETNSDATCDTETGETSGGPPFIGANLGKNDLINPSASEPWYINETVTRTYQDSTRETNHLRFVYDETSEDIGDYSIIYDYWFDQSTGVLVEYTQEFSYSDATTTTHSELISSNLWLINENSSENSPTNPTTVNVPAVAAIITIVIIIVAAIFLKKRKSKDPGLSANSV